VLFPADPSLQPALWDSLTAQLARADLSFIISKGVGNLGAAATRLGQSDATEVLRRMREADVCAISANRGNAITPHFAGRCTDGHVVLTEFMAIPRNGSGILDIETAQDQLARAVLYLFMAPQTQFRTVGIPLPLQPWSIDGASARQSSDGLTFTNRA
jgi:hypothetical protein